MIHAKAVLACVATSLVLFAPADARSGTRELLQSTQAEGRKGKDKNGNIIPETQPDGASTVDVQAASCTACTGSCESCANVDVENGVTISNCGVNAAGKYTCDVSLSNAYMPWKGTGGISWGRINGGACEALTPCGADSPKKEEITGATQLYTVEFPDAPCSSAELCVIVHDGSLDPCKAEGTSEAKECPVQAIGDKCVSTSNQLCKVCQNTIKINKPAGAGCDDGVGCTTTDECYGDGCGLAGAAGALGACKCNIKTVGGTELYQNTDDGWCRDPANNFGDAYTCSQERCDPANASGTSHGCVYNQKDITEANGRCGDGIACTEDLCGSEATPLKAGEAYGSVNNFSGCVNRKQDSVCADASNGFADSLACTKEVCTATSATNGGCKSYDSTKDETTSATCQDGFSCTENKCLSTEPTTRGVYDARGCFASLDTANACGDAYACTADRCVLEYELPGSTLGAKPANINCGLTDYDCVRLTSGCVFERKDNVCTPLATEFGCGAFACLDESPANSVDVSAYGSEYTGCFGAPGDDVANQCDGTPQCGTEVCVLSDVAANTKPTGCDVDVKEKDNASCDDNNVCTKNICVASAPVIEGDPAKGSCSTTEIDTLPDGDVCVPCVDDLECKDAAEPCEHGTCRTVGDYAGACDFVAATDCQVCTQASDCSTKPCKTANCVKKAGDAQGECTYTDESGCETCSNGVSDCTSVSDCRAATCTDQKCSYTDLGAGDSCGSAGGCCSAAGVCDVSNCDTTVVCTGENDGAACGTNKCCNAGECGMCQECYATLDCAGNAAGECCDGGSCVACPPSCNPNEADSCAAYDNTCCITKDAGTPNLGVCLSEGCDKPNPCGTDTTDTDGDGLNDCVDPCPDPGSGQTETCPTQEASHPSYFTLSGCSDGTATVVYNRAPQLKTNNCDPNDAISWVTTYWLGADGKAGASMCTKVDEIPADGQVQLNNVPCGEEVFVVGHDGKFPDNSATLPQYEKSSPNLILDGGCTSNDTGNKCFLGSVTIDCGTCVATR